MKYTIDIMRTSASRPECLRLSTESLLKNLVMPDTEVRWMIHEDVLNGPASDECLKIIEDSKLYEVVKFHNPPLTQAISLCWLMSRVTADYVINWEDDWELIKLIDVERLICLMDAYPEVNQIAFQKRALMSHRYSFIKKQIYIDDVPLVSNPHWAFTPSIMRTSWIKPKWAKVNFPKGCNPVWQLNPYLKQYKVTEDNIQRDADWMMKNVGCYFLGEIGNDNSRFIRALGASVRRGKYKWEN